MTSASHLKAIHTLKSRSGLQEDEFRALLRKETGKASSKDLSDPVAGRFIEVLKGFAPVGKPAAAPRAGRATGKYAPVLQALWLSAWNLGLVRSNTDAALMGFVKRQTGLSHTRFLIEAAEAALVIEALKKWIARDGGVAWPADRDDTDPVARKMAVTRAIAARLAAAGGFTPFIPGGDPWPHDFMAYGRKRGLPQSFTTYGADDWDRLANALGARLRAVLANKAKEINP